MGSIINCLKIHGIKGREAERVKELFETYKKEGYAPFDASREAIGDILKQAEKDRISIINQIREQIEPKEVVEPKPPPEIAPEVKPEPLKPKAEPVVVKPKVTEPKVEPEIPLRPEPIEEISSKPIQVGEGWTKDRGIIPGEPIGVYKDKYAVIERFDELDNVLYEVMDTEGQSHGIFQTVKEAKNRAESIFKKPKAEGVVDPTPTPTISFMGTGEIQTIVSDMVGAVRKFKNKGTEAEWKAWHRSFDTKVDDIGNSIYEQYKPKFNEFVQRMKETLGDLWKQFRNRMLDIYRKARTEVTRVIREERGGIEPPEFLRGAREGHREGKRTFTGREKRKADKRIERIKTEKDIVNRRRQMVRSVRDHFGLTDKDIQSITRRDIRLMSNYEYKRFLDDLRVKAAEFEKHEQAKSQLLSQIQEKNLQKWQNLRKAYKLPPIDKMKTGEIERLDEIMEGFEPHDEFLSIRRLERVDVTELKGIKTIREAKERLAKEANVPISELEKIKASEFDRFRFDTDLARQNPFYNLLIDEKIKGDIQATRNLFEFEKSLNYYASKARRSRGRKLLDILIPQDKRVMEYVESTPEAKDTLAKEMTPQELDYASFLLNKGNEALHYLIEEGVLRKSTYAGKYAVHIRQGLLEGLKDEGLKGAVKNVFDRYEHDEQVFNILDTATGEVLPLEKFFKFSMFRTGKIKPSQNLAKSFLEYWRSFETKKNLDRLILKMSIYVRALEPIGKTERGLLKDAQLERFFKEWMNTKKGRHVTLLAKQGGKFDLSLRGLNNLVTVMDLGLNIPVGITANIGETGFNYIMLGKKNFTKGLIRKRTTQGRKILEKYKFWTGKGVWEELQEASKDIGDKANDVLFGLFKHGMTEANKTYLLGSLTGTEFNTGIISDVRLAQMKKDMGEYRYIEGAGSIIGATPEAKSFLKYKTWAVPPLKTTAHNLKNIAKAVAGKGKINPKEAWQLYRSIEIITAVLLVGMLIDVDKKDPTFLGRLKSKAMREAMSIMGALNHKLWATAPRIVSFATSLADVILDIVTLTEYEKTTKYGDKGELKGVRKLKRIATPRGVSQFGTGYTEGYQLIDEYSKAVRQQNKGKIAELREQIRDFNLKRKEQGKEPIYIIKKALDKVRREKRKEREKK